MPMIALSCGFLMNSDVTSFLYPVAMDTCMYADQTESWKFSCADDTTYKHIYAGNNDCSGTATSELITPFAAWDIHCGSGDACDIAHIYYDFYAKAPTDNECTNLIQDPYYFDSKTPTSTGYLPLVLNQCSSYEDQWTLYSCKDVTTSWSAVEYFTGKPSCNKTAYSQYSFGDSSCYEESTTVQLRRDVIATMCRPEPTGAPTPDPTTAAPTANPITSAPTAVPTTITYAPTAAPVTQSPTAAPITSAPTANPITSAPTIAPVTESPTVSPVTSNPITAAPITSAPTVSPVESSDIKTTKTRVHGSTASRFVCIFAFEIVFFVLLRM